MKDLSKTRFFCVLFVFFTFFSTSISASDSPFSFKLIPDISLATGALVLNILPFAIPQSLPPENAEYPLSASNIPSFDRWALRPHSQGLDIASEWTQYLAFFAPLALFAAPSDDWLLIGTMYLETALAVWGIKESAKVLFGRARPYLYTSIWPEDWQKDGYKSFPSGHTSLAFAGATFSSYVFSVYYPNSPWRWPLIAGTTGLALSTAVFRVASGNHFISDVLVGALIGAGTGFLVPFLHRNEKNRTQKAGGRKNGDFSVSLLPGQVLCRFSL